jgi:hypothetical protein
LADPEKHWKRGRSAFETAVAWEAASRSDRGLPPSIASVLDTEPAFAGATLLLGVPEHQVVLDGGGHPSQTDLWAVLATTEGVASVAIEAKAGEPFDKPVRDWIADAPSGSGKPARLEQLCAALGLSRDAAMPLRYQLMHRSVAALLEGQRLRLARALFLVQHFGSPGESLADYKTWASALGVEAHENRLHRVGNRLGLDFWIGWVTSGFADDATVAAVV